MGVTAGFLLVLAIGVASADESGSTSPAPLQTTIPVELAPAVVVAAGADSIDAGAIARLSARYLDRIEFGTAFQLDDGRIVTVAHALVGADSVRFGTLNEAIEIDNPELDPDVAISRVHDVAWLQGAPLAGAMPVAETPAIVGDSVALAGIPEDGRIHVVTGEIISRAEGIDYGLGRPEVYAISATVDAGYSGGPVVNAAGEVVAIIVGVETRSGVALAVPIEYLPR